MCVCVCGYVKIIRAKKAVHLLAMPDVVICSFVIIAVSEILIREETLTYPLLSMRGVRAFYSLILNAKFTTIKPSPMPDFIHFFYKKLIFK